MPNWVSKPSAVWPNGRGHHAGIGDDEVERPAVGEQRVGAGAHAGERGEVELDQLDAAAIGGIGAHHGGRGLGLGEIAGGADHLGAVGGQRAGRLDAEPGGDAGHQHALAAQVDAREHLVGGRVRTKRLGQAGLHDASLVSLAPAG